MTARRGTFEEWWAFVRRHDQDAASLTASRLVSIRRQARWRRPGETIAEWLARTDQGEGKKPRKGREKKAEGKGGKS